MSTWSQYEGEAIPRRIFVGGIDPTTTETDLKILFERCGRVITVNIIRNWKGSSYGFVTFQCEESARIVLSQRFSFYLRGKKLRISAAYLTSKPRMTFR